MENEQELLDRADEEREKIFRRYELGTDPSNEIDPWENPSFEVYHHTDKYGFIHDKRLPDSLDPNEIRKTHVELERAKKWIKMIQNWDLWKNSEKLYKRTYKGVPNRLRWPVWKKFLGVEESMKKNPGVYEKMVKLARLYCTDTRQIDSDVNRQFRENIAYRQRYSVKQRNLFNVLNAYSMYNQELGYCQGMSGVAGVLLMYMYEEEAFWAFNTLMVDKKYAMHGLFVEGFPKLTRFLEHHDRLVAKLLRKLHRHFVKHNVDSILYSLKWFFVVFIERIPYNLCLRIWDIYLLEGERVVTAMAFTILYLHKNELLKLKDMDAILEFLQVKLHKNFGYNDDYVINTLEHVMKKLHSLKLDSPSKPKVNECPLRPLGIFTEIDIDKKIGRRRTIFTETEKQVLENVISRQESNAAEVQSNISLENSDGATGDAYSISMKTYRSYNSLATSVAVSGSADSFDILERVDDNFYENGDNLESVMLDTKRRNNEESDSDENTRL